VSDPDRVQRHEPDEPQLVAQDEPCDEAGREPENRQPVVKSSPLLGIGSVDDPFTGDDLFIQTTACTKITTAQTPTT
jgi:hypothetical protein